MMSKSLRRAAQQLDKQVQDERAAREAAQIEAAKARSQADKAQTETAHVKQQSKQEKGFLGLGISAAAAIATTIAAVVKGNDDNTPKSQKIAMGLAAVGAVLLLACVLLGLTANGVIPATGAIATAIGAGSVSSSSLGIASIVSGLSALVSLLGGGVTGLLGHFKPELFASDDSGYRPVEDDASKPGFFESVSGVFNDAKNAFSETFGFPAKGNPPSPRQDEKVTTGFDVTPPAAHENEDAKTSASPVGPKP